MAESLNEQYEADAISKETNDRHTERDVDGGNARADRESGSTVDNPCDESLTQADLRWVAAEILRVRLLPIPRPEAGCGMRSAPLETARKSLSAGKSLCPRKGCTRGRCQTLVHVSDEKDFTR